MTQQLLLGAVLGALTTVAAVSLVPTRSMAARDVQDSQPADAPTMAEMMKLAQPGPEHAELAAIGEGEWLTEISMRMAAGAPPMKVESPETRRMVLGGRFVELHGQGQFMGMDMERLTYLGFDRRNEEYTLVQFDSGGTYWITARGKEDPESGVIELFGEDEAPWGTERYRIDLDLTADDEVRTAVTFFEQGGRTYDPPFTQIETVSRPKAD